MLSEESYAYAKDFGMYAHARNRQCRTEVSADAQSIVKRMIAVGNTIVCTTEVRIVV